MSCEESDEEFDNDFLSIGENPETDSYKNINDIGCICCIPIPAYFLLKVLFLRYIFRAEQNSNTSSQQYYDSPILKI